jgi:alpha-1,3-rhamnosyl/mannosyltransferase
MAKAQAQGWLLYLAFVDQSCLPALYAGAALFAYPSLYEGFGLPLIEAMASGAPVLTSNVSCMPEVAGGAARLVDPLDVEELSYALQVCLTSEAWQSQARGRGLARATTYSWDQCAQRTVGIYAGVVGS